MKILIVGDVFGTSGREMLEKSITKLRQEKGINFVVVNGENIAHGKGITEKYYRFLLEQNVNAVTLGNHAFGNHDIYHFINDANKLIRPLNLPKGVPGVGYITVRYNNIDITVFQVMGRVFMNTSLDCPFQATEELLKTVKSDIYICDFHGEATSEKIAYGHYFDGRIHIIVGTHTHVQTNDAHILEHGTMYMTDLGMTGPRDGVIGVEKEAIYKKFLLGLPSQHTPMEKGKKQFCGLIVDFNESRQKTTNFEVINMVE